MRMSLLAFPLACVALSGCAGSLGISALGQQAPAIAGQLDGVVNGIILQKATDLHNLQVGLAQINATPGMVVSVTPPPVIASPSPGPVTMTPAPIPVPVPTPVTPTPTPAPVSGVPGTFPTSPTVTPTTAAAAARR